MLRLFVLVFYYTAVKIQGKSLSPLDWVIACFIDEKLSTLKDLEEKDLGL